MTERPRRDAQPLTPGPSPTRGEGSSASFPPGNLRARAWKRFLSGPDPALLDELYVPALAEAVRYDRCCAYFSSSVLSAAARGFGRLIERLLALGDSAPRPAVRLVVNEELTAEDVRALMEAGDTSGLEESLAKRFKLPKDVLEKKRLEMLGWLVKQGLLEVRVGVMRHGTGIVHAKFGIMTDEAGGAVVFSGSGNESAKGLVANYERLEVSGSWSDPDRYRVYADEFASLWKDNHSDVHTVSLPEALQLKLIRFAPEEPPVGEPSNALARQKAAMLWRFLIESPYFLNGGPTCDATAMVDLWPHQGHVVEEVAEAWPEGRLLCDEVGLGKTIEAILALRRLMAGRGVKRVLLLLPAGLLRQWQAELREKGGMIVPRLEGTTALVWPDGTTAKISGIPEALQQNVLIMSRETARTQGNLAHLLAADPWDLVLLDEAHAARRRQQVEGEFNSGNLLLNLLRQLQLRRRTRGIMLLSATPMQIQPWEPWDLLSVLGEGGAWLADFAAVRDFYGVLADVTLGQTELPSAQRAAETIVADSEFPPPPGESQRCQAVANLARSLVFASPARRTELARWMRTGSPLYRRMHRNTRDTLRKYHAMGLLDSAPPRRVPDDVQFDFEDDRERAVYNAITGYINRRFEELEGEKTGKGFVMTVYRRRAASSPLALRRSLERRREGLQRVIQERAYDATLLREDAPEAVDPDDLPEDEEAETLSAALPHDPEVARKELREVEDLLDDLTALGSVDSKRDRFFTLLKQVTDDGRSALVFTGYTDTMEYLRDTLADYYGDRLGCYSGDGGCIWDGSRWKTVTKDVITRMLREGKLTLLVCTDAASEGLNLQAAGAVVNYDLPWNPSKVEQRIGRIDRIGQKCPCVWVVNLFLKDSVDEQVYRVLRARCHLFQHFVGAMQPVLARARRMLLGQEVASPEALEEAARQIEQDRLAQETYIDSDAHKISGAKPAVSRQSFEHAISQLNDGVEVRLKNVAGGAMVEIVSDAVKRTRFGKTVQALEANPAALPLSPFDDNLKSLAESLWRPGERLPLVVGSCQDGAFRTSVALWVGKGDKEIVEIESYEHLGGLVEAWDGEYPSTQDLNRAKTTATNAAYKEVQRRIAAARQREKKALRSQLAAARLRLRGELGRFLVCVAGTRADLNRVFHEQMTRDIAGAKRLQRCYHLLGGYPKWPDQMKQELDLYYEEVLVMSRLALPEMRQSGMPYRPVQFPLPLMPEAIDPEEQEFFDRMARAGVPYEEAKWQWTLQQATRESNQRQATQSGILAHLGQQGWGPMAAPRQFPASQAPAPAGVPLLSESLANREAGFGPRQIDALLAAGFPTPAQMQGDASAWAEGVINPSRPSQVPGQPRPYEDLLRLRSEEAAAALKAQVAKLQANQELAEQIRQRHVPGRVFKPTTPPVEQRDVSGNLVGEPAGAWPSPIQQYSAAMGGYRDLLAQGEEADYPGAYAPVRSLGDMTSQEAIKAAGGRTKKRREAEAPRQELVTARARGQTPAEYRMDIGTASPLDVAGVLGLEAALLTPEMRQHQLRLAADEAASKLLQFHAQAKASIAAALGENKAAPQQITAALNAYDISALKGQGAPTARVAGEDVLSTVDSSEVQEVADAASKMPPNTLTDIAKAKTWLRSNHPTLSENAIDEWLRRRFGYQAWRQHRQSEASETPRWPGTSESPGEPLRPPARPRYRVTLPGPTGEHELKTY